MNRADENSAGNINDATGQRLHVIKIYPLDGKPIAESQLWIAVAQVQNEIVKRLFLKDRQQHRLISETSAFRLLSDANKKDLSIILKATSHKVRPLQSKLVNVIENIQNRTSSSQSQSAISQPNGQYIGNVDVIHISDSQTDTLQSLSATSNSPIDIAALVQMAQLKSWGSIKVYGSEFFRRQVWLEAASRGMYIEGYDYTEDDRQALFKRVLKSAREHIRAEYKPANKHNKSLSKFVAIVDSKSKIIKKLNNADSKNQNCNNQSKSDVADLSEQELTYLLMRVHQIDLDGRNTIMPDDGLPLHNNIFQFSTDANMPSAIFNYQPQSGYVILEDEVDLP